MIDVTLLGSSGGLPLDQFGVKLYTGNEPASNVISGLGFQPDLLFVKCRTFAWNTPCCDSMYTASEYRYMNLDNPDQTDASGLVFESLDSDGFTMGPSGVGNANGEDFIAWCFRADTPGIVQTAPDPVQEEQYSVGSGVSILKYQGNGLVGREFKHSLGAVPKMAFFKNVDTTGDWIAYLGFTNGEDYAVSWQTNSTPYLSAYWNNTAPTINTFTTNSFTRTNTSGENYIGVFMSDVPGRVKFGTYTGNGSATGPVVTGLGFDPDCLMIKSRANNSWGWWDTVRNPTNPATARISHDQVAVEANTHDIDFNTDGFQIKNANAGSNTNGVEYFYMARKII